MAGTQLSLGSLRIPAICAPMFLVTNVEMVAEACLAGIMGVLPRGNFRTAEEFEAGLAAINARIARAREQASERLIGPLAVNFGARSPEVELSENIAICRRQHVDIVVTALGNPAEVVRRCHDWGGRVLHDVTSLAFAEKAIAAGVDGVVAVAWGGGGHSGTMNPFVLIPQIRAGFDGIIVLAGGISTGGAIRAAEALGADLAYLGTRFIATRESGAPQAYKQMLVDTPSEQVLYTAAVNGAPASWLRPSLVAAGLDPDNLPTPAGFHDYSHLPQGFTPWRDIWSGGQGTGLIRDIPGVGELVDRLAAEYRAACARPSLAAE